MSFRCPGYLNAKSLSEGGDCREDYVEWFSNPVLSQHRPLIDAVYRTMQYRGDDPVLLVCDISAEACLLFRFTMKSQDRKGRNHQRCEVMMVNQSDKPALLNGEFKAVPDEDNKEFVVDSVNGAALPQCERHRVNNEVFNVYARNPKAYWFKSEAPAPKPLSRQSPTSDSKRPINQGRTVDRSKNGERIMCRVLLVFLIVSCVLGGWNYFQSTSEIEQLRNILRTREDEVTKRRTEIENLQKENGRLQKEINKFGKWIKTRSNFELNKVQLKIKFDEIIKNFRETENLWAHIDETPNPTSKVVKEIAERDGVSRSRNDVGKGAGMETGSSGRGQTKGDGKKKEKGIFETLGEKVESILP